MLVQSVHQRHFWVIPSWKQSLWTDALPSDQGKLLCKARHSTAVQLHLSLLLTFGGRVVKSQLPPPRIMLESRVGLVSEAV